MRQLQDPGDWNWKNEELGKQAIIVEAEGKSVQKEEERLTTKNWLINHINLYLPISIQSIVT